MKKLQDMRINFVYCNLKGVNMFQMPILHKDDPNFLSDDPKLHLNFENSKYLRFCSQIFPCVLSTELYL